MARKTDRAASKLKEATEQVEQWKRRAEQVAGELSAAEASVGTDALASGDLEGAAAKLSGLHEQLDAAWRTVAAAEAQRDAAQCDAWRAEAEQLRSDAAKVERDAEKQVAKTRDLLNQLREHEGGSYVPDQPTPGVGSDKHFWTPRSARLANEAKRLRNDAHSLEQKARSLEQQMSTPRESNAA